MSEDNRAELARLMKEQMSINGWGVSDVAAKMNITDPRNIYNWVSGANKPQRRVYRDIEAAMGWEAGAVQRILEAPITEIPSLSEVRDWSLVEQPPKTRLSEVPVQRLLMELSARWTWQEDVVEDLKERLSKYEGPTKDNPGNVRNLFDLAAHNTSAGRNMEHLEGDD